MKEPWEKLLDKHEGDRNWPTRQQCKHDWGEPFDGQIKCRKCGTYAEGDSAAPSRS